jgi:hypothetical protein
VVLVSHLLLDLQHQVHTALDTPGRVGIRHDLGTGRDVLLIANRGPHPGTGLDEHPMTVRHQLVHPDRRDRHPILVILDFLRYADK